METPIFDFVKKYADSGTSRLHMPGHKGTGPLGCERWDITEIMGADSLYEASGIIAQSEKNAAALFGSRCTLYSAGGSSQCIKAMLYLALQRGHSRTILSARNVHKAFVHAAALLDFEVQWLWPEPYELLRCCVTEEMVEQALRQADPLPAAVYVTSPDYLGNVQPIEKLAHVCHRYGVPLIVDNAHGAYLHFLSTPAHPLDLGADLCCDSAHKTLPVLTGGAYLHMGGNMDFGGEAAGRQALSLFGSTSPSYLILQSLDLCNVYLSQRCRSSLSAAIDQIAAVKQDLLEKGWAVQQTEPLKIVVRAPRCCSGIELAQKLRSHKVECEYADPDYVVLMATPNNTEEDYRQIRQAFSACRKAPTEEVRESMAPPIRAMSIRKALLSPWEEIPVQEAAGRVCGAPTVSCPPAVPVVVSGEIIARDAIAVFSHYGIPTVCVVRDA